MKANDFHKHCMKIAHWVNWKDTVDQFMYGDPEIDVKGIGVTWLATDAVINKAAQMGLNFVISHEGAFYPQFLESETEKGHHENKRKLMKKLGITLMRCHDTWDRMPEVGIPDSWADFLGFTSEPRDVKSFYKICNVEGLTVEDVAKRVLEKIKPLGQKHVSVIGNLKKKVSRLAVGTGAITNPPQMHELGADVILGTDDGVHTTYCGLWSLDLDIPVLVVNHPTAELPGMMEMARYIENHFPDISVKYLPCDFPYYTIDS